MTLTGYRLPTAGGAATLPATVDLPAPPSANALFVVRDGRRVKTEAYRQWRRDAGMLLAVSGMPQHPPKTPLRVTIGAAVNRTRDVDNLIKPTIDALQAAGIIPDDRWVDEVLARRIPAGDVEAGGAGSGSTRCRPCHELVNRTPVQPDVQIATSNVSQMR